MIALVSSLIRFLDDALLDFMVCDVSKTFLRRGLDSPIVTVEIESSPSPTVITGPSAGVGLGMNVEDGDAI